MKTLVATAAIAILVCGCDRTMDNSNPEPIAPGNTGPGTAYHYIVESGAALPTTQVDAVSDSGAQSVDTLSQEVAQEVSVGEVNQCTGTQEFCDCMGSKNDDPRYSDYCSCFTVDAVPGGDAETYCGCCYFGYDDTFSEYEQWSMFVSGTCDPQGYSPPCQ